MKFLVLAASLSVCSSQGFFGLVSHPNGAITPVDEPAVANARAEHLTAKGALYAAAPVFAAASPVTPLSYAAAPTAYAPAYGYSGPLNLNNQLIAHPNGAVVPVDEPAVAQARVEHLNAHGAVYAAQAPVVTASVAAYSAIPAVAYAAAPAAYAPAYGYSGPLNLNNQLIAHPNGAVVPVDEPAVVQARVEHLNAHGAIYAAKAPVVTASLAAYSATPAVAYAAAPAAYAPAYGYSGPLNLNNQLIAHPNGAVVPVDEPAVVQARAAHLNAQGAVYAAQATVVAAPLAAHSATPAVSYAAAPTAYAPTYGYSGPLNLNNQLIAHPNGAVVPVDEPAVAQARAEHLNAQGAVYAALAPVVAAPVAAYAAAPTAYAPTYGYSGPLNLNSQLIAHPNGAVVPVDEPAVVQARAEHLNAQGAIYAAHAPVVAAPVAAYSAFPTAAYAAASSAYAPSYGYAGPLNLNTQLVAHPNGAVTPVDEPAVVAARAEHLATKGAVYAAQAPVIAAAPAVAYSVAPVAYSGAPASFAGLVAHPNGAIVPVDTPAVAAARANHLLSKGVYGGVYANAAPVAAYGGLVAYPNGAIVPVDEPAVAAARTKHLALQG